MNSVNFNGQWYNFSPYDSQIIELKIHWLHGTIGNQYLVHFFSKYGKVLGVRRLKEFLDNEQIKTGIRYVDLQLQSYDTDLPYFVKMGKRMSMRISTTGRLPICFNCNRIGHLLSACPDRQPPSRFTVVSDTYAKAAKIGLRDQDAASITSMSERGRGVFY